MAASGEHGVSLAEATRVWLRVAALSFGGPAGQIAVMHRIIVDEKRWISDNRFLHALNYCMLLPGPEAQQLATYIGWLMHRTRGGLIAGGLFILPGVIAIMALSYIYAAFGRVGVVASLFFGLKAAVLAIVLEAVVRIGRRALANSALIALAGIAFVAIFFLRIPFPVIIIGAALIGFFGDRLGLTEFRTGGHGGRSQNKVAVVDELIGDRTPEHAQPSMARALQVTAIWLPLWLGPVIVLLLALGSGNVFSQIAVFFSKMAVVTFGGAYAVLAYVAQQAVENYHWLRPGEMLDGLGMAETTPGPLIMVLQFVGFLAADRDPGGLPPMLAGTLGGLLATWVTFAPCFFWIFLGAPFIEKLRGNRALGAALSAITAAVVGVVLNLAIWFAIHALFSELEPVQLGPINFEAPVLASLNPWAALLSAIALLAVFRFHIGMIPTLAGASLAGFALYVLGAFTAPTNVAAAATEMQLEAKIPLGAIRGRIDHFAIDMPRQRLYVAELGSNSVGVVDLRTRVMLRTIGGFAEPQGVLYVPSTDQVYVANAGDGSVQVLSGGDWSAGKRIDLGADADNIRLDQGNDRVFIGYGSGSLAAIDPKTGGKATKIALPEHPEGFQLETTANRVFVNVPEAEEIAVADRSTGKVLAHWHQADRANFAMAIDEPAQQLIVAFRVPPVLRSLEIGGGSSKQRLPTCADVDDLFVDAKRQRLYVICGAGAIAIFELRQGNLAQAGQVSTAPGARTGLFVPELDRLYVAVPASTQEAPAIWVFKPSP